MEADQANFRPLEGTVVVELGDSAAAPYAGYILASLGATVWKIERPGPGDTSRSWGSDKWKGSGPIFHGLNRGKKSVVIDIKNDEELSALKQLIATQADVFLHNLRPGTSQRYGLDETSLCAQNPKLVHCAIGAFGSKGPLNQLPGFDPLLQAFSGIMSVTGEAGQAPVRCGISVVDLGTGMWAALGIITSLLARKSDGRGRSVDISLFETSLSLLTAVVSDYQVTEEIPTPMGSGVGFVAPYKAFCANDGYLVIACGNDRLFAKLCGVFGTQHWLEDDRFSINAQRVIHRDAINALVQEIVATRSRQEWREAFDAAGVPCAPIQTINEVVNHPQTRALGILNAVSDDPLELVGMPFSVNGVRPSVDRGAPDMGASNAEMNALLNQTVD